MRWLVKVIGGAIAGAALLSALERLGWYQARDIIQWISSFIDTQILRIIFAPFSWIEVSWANITTGEYMTVVFVWAIMIAPALRAFGTTSVPDAVLLTRPPDPVLKLVGLVFGGTVLAFLLGLFCFLIPAPISIWALIGWAAYIQIGILMATINIMGRRPATEEEFYELAAAKIRMKTLWAAYAETAVGASILAAVDQLL